MKVAIWGSLNYGNFGDDVMNVIFALEVKKMGAIPCLYRLDADLARQYGLDSVDNLDDLLKDASFSFIGGGSWLESRKLGDSYEEDFHEFLRKLHEYNMPFYAISIGGDSIVDRSKLSDDRIKLFSDPLFQGGTVRLEESMELMRQLGKRVELHPDIVIDSAKYFVPTPAVRREADRKFRIGITWTGRDRYLSRLIRGLEWLPPLYRNYEIFFLNTHLPRYGLKYEYQYDGASKNIHNKQYETLEDFYGFVQSLDCMISSKLHPGVAALSCGTPFIWMKGSDKTRSFLKTVGLDQYEYSKKEVMWLILAKSIIPLVRNYSLAEFERQKPVTAGHLNYLEQAIRKHARS